MRICEFLQAEVWSNRRSQRLLVGLGICLAVVIFGSVLWRVVDRNWITPGERSAAGSALEKLDALQDTGFLNTREFVVWAKLAGRRVDDARQVAWTARDRKIVAELMSYQSTIVVNHALEEKQVLAQQESPSRKPGQLMQGFALSGIGFDSRELHKALD